MTPPTQDELFAIARSYYPPGIDRDDPPYGASPERERYAEAWGAELEDQTRWKRLNNALEEEFPEMLMGDYTAPCFDGGRKLCVFLQRTAELESGIMNVVAACVSVLGPFYCIYGAQGRVENRKRVGELSPIFGELPDQMAPYAAVMARHIEEIYQYRPVPDEVLHVRVPDISVDPLPLGEGTLFNALFTTAPEYFP